MEQTENKMLKNIINKEDDRRPTSYTKERVEREKRLRTESYKRAQDLYFMYLEFYEVNYPKSTHDLEWDRPKVTMNVKEGDFEKILEKLSELELYNMLTVFDYGRKENFSNDMKEHYDHLYSTGFIRARIPGYGDQEKLNILKNKKRDTERTIRKLERQIKEKRIVFSKDQELKNKIVVCEICGKECARGSGLASHMRNKHPPLPKEHETMEEDL